MCMSSHRKTILVIHPPGRDSKRASAEDPAAIRRLLGKLGHIAVSADGPRAALKALGTVRFDVIFTSIGRAEDSGSRSFVQDLRALAPGSAVVGIAEEERTAANEAWLGECDATVCAPLSPSRVRWALDFELRYFGS
jgi:AmiR/NasT family two-component response regulator